MIRVLLQSSKTKYTEREASINLRKYSYSINRNILELVTKSI